LPSADLYSCQTNEWRNGCGKSCKILFFFYRGGFGAHADMDISARKVPSFARRVLAEFSSSRTWRVVIGDYTGCAVGDLVVFVDRNLGGLT